MHLLVQVESVDNLNMILAAIQIKIGTLIFSKKVLMITSVIFSHYLPRRKSVGAIKKKTNAQSVVR